MADTFIIEFDGTVLRRGFWLYVWDITVPDGNHVLYVGRTGDNSSPYAQALLWRVERNAGENATTQMVRKHLLSREIDVFGCHYRVVGHGPIFEQVAGKDFAAHKPLRDKVGALEKRLADDLKAAGYDVMNSVTWKPPLDAELYDLVRTAFEADFPALAGNP
jgi:hypothetical protein